MDADRNLVFNPRLSVFIGGHGAYQACVWSQPGFFGLRSGNTGTKPIPDGDGAGRCWFA
jgi:hypothetical protein